MQRSNGTSRVYRGSVTDDGYAHSTGTASLYFWHQTAVGGSDTIGLTAPTGQTYTVAAVEVLFSGGGTDATVTLQPAQANVTIHP